MSIAEELKDLEERVTKDIAIMRSKLNMSTSPMRGSQEPRPYTTEFGNYFPSLTKMVEEIKKIYRRC